MERKTPLGHIMVNSTRLRSTGSLWAGFKHIGTISCAWLGLSNWGDPATGIMRTLQLGDRPTQLVLAIAEFGRIEKTLHILNYIDDESRRRATLLQLNPGEGRHSLARDVFHEKRGELRLRYREGQEDQLGAIGLVVNVIVLWNTIYIDAILAQLRKESYPVQDGDIRRL